MFKVSLMFEDGMQVVGPFETISVTGTAVVDGEGDEIAYLSLLSLPPVWKYVGNARTVEHFTVYADDAED